jgi:predicted nucleic acid-binding protein
MTCVRGMSSRSKLQMSSQPSDLVLGRHQISFWDALIVQAANRGEAEILYSEDLNDGQRFGEVAVRNPFRMIAGR